jgi:hypothetical protein
MNLLIAVDFDGTCVAPAFPKIGSEIGAAPVLKRLVADGAKIILWTVRSGKPLRDAVGWFYSHGIPLHGVNRNPNQNHLTGSPKPAADIFIDDRGFGAPLTGPKGAEYVDWKVVERYFYPENP